MFQILINRSPHSVSTWFHLHRDFHRNKESTKNFANSTRRKSFVSIADFCHNSWTFVRLFLFSFNCCKVDNALFESIRTLLVRMKPPTTLVKRVLLWGQMVCMIFVRKSIPFSAKFFVSIIFNHSTTEFWISYESIMDSLEILFLLQLVSIMVFLVSRLLAKSMFVRSSFLDYVLGN